MSAASRTFSLCLFSCCLCAAAWAGDSKDIVTDRPDFVDAPEALDAGVWQLETSVAWERNTRDGANERSWSTPTLLRYGLGHGLEFRFGSDGRVWQRSTDSSGMPTRTNGWADATLGLKWHFLEGKDGAPSMGVLFDLDLDSGSDGLRGNGVRPSVKLSAGWDLPDEIELGIMPGIVFDKDDSGKRFTSGLLGIVLGREYAKGKRAFIELSLPRITSNRHGGTQASFDVGGAWLLTPNSQIDTALSRGLNSKTPEWSWTLGYSVRF